METQLPNHIYYRACDGAWRCELSLEIQDLEALRSSGMAWGDRCSLRFMAAWPRWLGRFFLETTVLYDTEGPVVHTTTVRWLGLRLMQSVERFALHADGQGFSVDGDQRVFPAVWIRRPLGGSGSVDTSGIRAEYSFEWLGTQLTQNTVREADCVTVTQRGPGFRGVQTLRRLPSLETSCEAP